MILSPLFLIPCSSLHIILWVSIRSPNLKKGWPIWKKRFKILSKRRSVSPLALKGIVSNINELVVKRICLLLKGNREVQRSSLPLLNDAQTPMEISPMEFLPWRSLSLKFPQSWTSICSWTANQALHCGCRSFPAFFVMLWIHYMFLVFAIGIIVLYDPY